MLAFKSIEQIPHRGKSGKDEITARGECESMWEKQFIV